jgi:hypothetical protein
MIIAGLYREAFGGGLPHVTWQAGTVPVGHHPSVWVPRTGLWG